MKKRYNKVTTLSIYVLLEGSTSDRGNSIIFNPHC